MPGIPVHVAPVTWASHAAQLKEIRTAVFVNELGVPPELEWDEADRDAEHFLALNEAGQALGCARLFADGKIGRMAVLPVHRKRGTGRLLLQHCRERAVALGLDKVYLHAQLDVVDFYRAQGFLPVGDTFQAAGIEHQAMEFVLPVEFPGALKITAKHDDSAARPPPPPPHAFEDLPEARRALLSIAGTAQRKISVFSPYLEHDLFDSDAMAQAFSEMARGHARAEIRILILSSKLIVSRGHRLLDLARRLDDKIRIRWLDEAANQDTSSFLCADTDAYWLLPNFEHHAGIAEQYNPVTTQQLQSTFDAAWARSKEDPELRRLQI